MDIIHLTQLINLALWVMRHVNRKSSHKIFNDKFCNNRNTLCHEIFSVSLCLCDETLYTRRENISKRIFNRFVLCYIIVRLNWMVGKFVCTS